MGIFIPEEYRNSRPFYPPAVFDGFFSDMGPVPAGSCPRIADIGCGSGQSFLSLPQLTEDPDAVEIIGVDPDPAMLEWAEKMARERGIRRFTARQGSGERTGIGDAELDGILVGSAFHWMDGGRTCAEFARILRPGGALRLFEYQFPKADGFPDLNEWIRRQFNLHWRAPDQKPRGSFRELTSVFDRSPDFTRTGFGRPPMRLVMQPEAFAALLFSQSRVVHFERTLSDGERLAFRAEVKRRIVDGFLGNPEGWFDFRLEWVGYRFRPGS